jgi:PAS domain S-box-containing protein
MSEPSQLLQTLQEQRDVIAERWYEAIAKTSYSVLGAAGVRDCLTALTEQAITVFLEAPLETEKAQEIGAALADLHYVRSKALGGTLRVLGDQLMQAVPVDQAGAWYPNLIALLEGVSTGFFREARQILLAEHEAIYEAFVDELRSTERALRKAHDELELRVEERTGEFAEANEELRREIEERQKAEAALRWSEEKYRDLVENVNEVIYAVDVEGRLTYVSPAVEALLGYRPAEVIGRSFTDFVFPADGPRLAQGFQGLLSGESQENEYRFVTQAGELRCVRTSSRPIVEKEHVVGGQGVLVDITERKRAEQELRESEERWRSVVENAPDFVVSVDRDGQILFLNRLEEDAEASPEELLGSQLVAYLLPEHQETVQSAIQKVFETGDSQYCEAAIRRADGSEAWYAAHIGAIRRDSEVAAALLITRNITERKKVDEIKDHLIHDVSHELRSPLAKVQMSLELLSEILEDEEIDREKARRISSLTILNVERLLDTVEGILDLSRLEAGVWAYQREVLDLNSVIEEAVGHMDALAKSKGVQLAARLPKDLALVEGDREKLFHVLVNVMDNAIKFSEEGQVVVSARSNHGEVEVAVRDEGQGILPENLERVFERFYQEKTRHQGVGVGLTIARAIVESHGGRIWAESQGRGQGTTIKFTLPIMNGQMEGA